MQNSETHYKTHLGPIYSWMLGDLAAAFARAAAEIDALPLPSGGIAVDLGAGLGLHAIPLARRGFEVVALDNCPLLLEELRLQAGSARVSTHCADLERFSTFLQAPAQLILCMGDTLTHLPSRAGVESLLAGIAAGLAPGGVFAATFRDYAARTLQGGQRFILVRADDRRILTCFLEYAESSVTVHDVLTEKDQGHWHQKVSSYPKLRLAPEWVAAQLTALGLRVTRDATAGGMARIVAVKA